MTIGISEKPSLLASLLTNEIREQTRVSPPLPDGIFSGKLDSILGENTKIAPTEQSTAQALAESLKLQMLRTTLALTVDEPQAPPLPSLFDRQSSNLQALIKAYSANKAYPDGPPAQQVSDTQPQPLPEITVAPPTAGSAAVAPPKGTEWLDPIIAKASRRYGVEVGLIKAVIKAESNFNPNAASHAGAQGLMQLMPGTARSLGVRDSFDPEQNVMAGTRFLSDLLKRYNGNLDSALAAYNWGPGNVDKRPDHLPRETRDYLIRVKQLHSSYTV